MKKILAMAGLAAALSGCIVIVDTTTSAKLNATAISARLQSTGNGAEYYICGNKEETVSVSLNYTGTFTSYRIVFVGELNPGNTLVKGPFQFDAANGDTSSSIIRNVVIGKDDVKPTAIGAKPQAVVVTPVPVPPQTTGVGLGSFKARVEMIDSNGTLTATSSGFIKVLGETNSNCQ
jgi:hypothetical protein